MEKVLLVSNARAGSVSTRTKEVIVKALQADFKLEVADTRAHDHVSDLASDAVDRGFHAVLVFGGDGTINEVAQGLVGSEVALGILPGGTTNVMARSIGVPRDPVDATAFVASHMRSRSKRRINVGRINERYFLFSAGMGLDAEVVKRVEADPSGKREHGEWSFLAKAFKTGLTKFRTTTPFMTLEVDGSEPVRVVMAICCNARPFTYFKRFPVDVCPEARLDRGLDVFALTKIRTSTVARIPWAVFVSRRHIKWRTSRYHHDVFGARFLPDDPLPVQVDGDYVGDWPAAHLSLVRSALDVLV